jgi:hypothetical protein
MSAPTLPTGTSLGAVRGTGSILSIGGVTGTSGTETFTPIGELSDGKFSDRKLASVSVTNFDSGGVARKIPGILDYGMFSATVIMVETDAGQLAAIAAQNSRQAYDFKLQLPINPKVGQATSGNVYAFSAIITECAAFDLSTTKVSEFTITLDIDGPITVTAGS